MREFVDGVGECLDKPVAVNRVIKGLLLIVGKVLLPIARKWHHVLEEELCVTRDLRRNVCMLILLLLLMCKMWWRAWTNDKTPFLGLGFEIRARNK